MVHFAIERFLKSSARVKLIIYDLGNSKMKHDRQKILKKACLTDHDRQTFEHNRHL